MPNLLVFGINYAPEPVSTGLNTTGLASGMAALGWSVTVITGQPHYPSWKKQPAPPDSIIDGVHVIRRPHYVPANQSMIKRGIFETSWFASSLPSLISKRPVDVVVGVVPNLSSAPLAALAAKRYRVPLVLLYQDLVGRAAEQTGIDGASRYANLIRSGETAIARGADAVAIVAESFRTYFAEGGVDPRRIHRIRNPHRLLDSSACRAQVRERLGWGGNEFIVLHSGNMGYKQGLQNVVNAARIVPPGSPIRFVLQGDGSTRQELELLAGQTNSCALSFLPLATNEEFPDILRAADLLLLNQKASVRNMSMPGKLGTYFAAGLPVVAAVSSEDETATEIARSGAGIVVPPEDPQALVNAAAELCADPFFAAKLGAAGKNHAEANLSEASFVNGMREILEGAIASRRVSHAFKG